MHAITYNEFNRDITALGTALIDLGLKDKAIAVIGENRYEWCVTYLAVVNGVGTIVPLDRELSQADIGNLLEQSQSSAVVFSEKYLDVVQAIKGNFPAVKHWICMGETDDSSIVSVCALISDGQKSIEAGSNAWQNAVIDPDNL